jgi:hypothetical protein
VWLSIVDPPEQGTQTGGGGVEDDSGVVDMALTKDVCSSGDWTVASWLGAPFGRLMVGAC